MRPSPHSLLALAPLLAGAASPPQDPEPSFVNWETPHVHPLELTPDGSRLLAVNLPDARLEVFDASGGVPVHLFSVPVGLDPVSVRARTSTEVWVVNQVSDSVSIVDLTARSVVETVTTDDEPADVVFTTTPARAFVSCSQANTLLVYDPTDLSQPPVRIPIEGEDPRALATNAAGTEVYLAVFESGNGSTILAGGAAVPDPMPPNVVSDPVGPYRGLNPPPNVAVDLLPHTRTFGPQFLPEPTPGLPRPPPVGLIVKRDGAGLWRDDNGVDWTDLVSGPLATHSGRFPGWTLTDHDLAVIDAASLTVGYVDGLMNICMGIGVNPVDGTVTVVGTDATNEIRFEPMLTGKFVRTKMAIVDPSGTNPTAIHDANPHLDYSTPTVPQQVRDLSLADPRAIVWNQSGSLAYVAGMGSNNVCVLDASGNRATSLPIEVGEGPTGLALSPGGQTLYVLDKFEAAISVVDVNLAVEVARVPFFDPTPAAIKIGRKHLYDARATSGLGVTACASCHVDARFDRLGWDLGNPAGEVKLLAGQNLGANLPDLQSGFGNWHPMKGPMTTQTLQDIIGKEPLHWRGDKDGLEEFNGAFVGLQGDDEMLDPQEMQELEDFLATIYFPPNPFRRYDNTLESDVPLPGFYTTGQFGPADQPLPDGNAARGLHLFNDPASQGGASCSRCHTIPVGMGTDTTFVNGQFEPIELGPNGEHHHMLRGGGNTNKTMKVPQLRNLYERTGFHLKNASTAGFGLIHDGSFDSLPRVLAVVAPNTHSDQDVADFAAFLLSFSGSDLPLGSPTEANNPPGTLSQDTHAAVGKQVTVKDGSAIGPVEIALVNAILNLADAGDVDVVVKGNRNGLARGWLYRGNDRFQSDRANEVVSKAGLVLGAGPGEELTFTVVPRGSGVRIGLDRDLDRAFDRDELDAGSDPADPTSHPKIRRAH